MTDTPLSGADGTQKPSEALPPIGLFGQRIAYRHYALAILTLTYILNYMDRQILSILLQPIKEEFGAADWMLGLLSGFSFALFYATLGIPIAMLADRVNRRNVIAASLAIFSIMTIFCGMAVQFWQLLLARIGVGVGEAGTSPPSHSMIADLYPPHQRATALAIFATGVNIGLMIGLFGGGWIAQHYGWRMAFLVAGIPGLLLAAFIMVGLREPPRGHSENRTARTQQRLRFITVFSTLMRQRTFRHLSFAAALNAFVGYGAVAWTPAFLIRSHGMSLEQIGIILALMFGILGFTGTIFGGRMADMLTTRDIRWQMWVPGIAIIVAGPFGLGFYLLDDTTLALVFYAVPVLVGTIYLGPTFAATQALSPLHMRAAAAALLLFIINIIGLGLGPMIVGLVSDLLAPTFAQDSLRWALLIVGIVNFWSGAHFILAARTLKADMDATARADA